MAFICTQCHYEGHRHTVTPGSRGMEWFLWLVFLFPGPIYSAWRMIARAHYCPHCGLEGTMYRSWYGKGKIAKWESEAELIREIEAMEDRLREKRQQNDQN